MLTASGCAASGGKPDLSLALPPIPGDIRVCINKTVPQPERIKTKADVVRVITELKKSERAKTACGKRLINLYDRHRELFTR